MILRTVEQAQARSGQSVEAILAELGLSAATYYRWQAQAQVGRLADQVMVPRHQALPPMPDEVAAVCAFALNHPAMGYKRLTWLMVDKRWPTCAPIKCTASCSSTSSWLGGRRRRSKPCAATQARSGR